MNKGIQQVIKGSAGVLLGLLYFKILDYGMKAMMGRLFGEEVLGLYNLFVSLFFVLSPLALLGMHMGAKRFIAEAYPQSTHIVKDIVRNATLFVAGNSVVVAALIFALSGVIASTVFQNPDHANLLQWFALGMPFFVLMMLFTTSFEGMDTVKFTVFMERMLLPTVVLVGVVLVYLLKLDTSLLYVSYIIGLVLTAGLLLVFMSRRGLFKRPEQESGIRLKKILNYSWPLMFHSLLYIFLAQSSLYVVQFFLGEGNVGLYTAASENAKLIPFSLAAIAPMYFTVSSRLNATDRREEAKSLYLKASNTILLFTLPAIMVLFVFAEDVLQLTYGSVFVASFHLLQILLIGYFVDVFIGPVDMFLNSMDRTRLVLLNSLAALTVGIALSIILVPRIGLAGAAIGTATAIAVQNTLGGIELWVLAKMNVLTRQKLLSLVVILCISVAGYMILQYADLSWQLRIVLAFGMAGCYAGVLARYLQKAVKTTLQAILKKGARS